jgi:transglutaminase-like putative cysteine protease
VVVNAETSWRLSVEHTTTYRYSNNVRASFNEVRVVPQTNERQLVLESRVSTTPSTAMFRYRDYWGTQVLAFDIAHAHDLLQVRASAVVETRTVPTKPSGSWEDVAAARRRHFEFCLPSAYTACDEELREEAARLRRPTPAATVEAVAAWVHDALDYAPGSTAVETSAVEAWRARRGVCQDFSHLAVTLLRTLAIPARYVSGYLHHNEVASPGDHTVGESHAWFEAWIGGWWAIDPTNEVTVGPGHVMVAHGRDYSDVPPAKGIYAGTAEDDMSVEVKLTRVA